MSVLVAFINRFSYGYVLLWCLLHRLRSLFLLFRNRIYTLLYVGLHGLNSTYMNRYLGSAKIL